MYSMRRICRVFLLVRNFLYFICAARAVSVLLLISFSSFHFSCSIILQFLSVVYFNLKPLFKSLLLLFVCIGKYNTINDGTRIFCCYLGKSIVFNPFNVTRMTIPVLQVSVSEPWKRKRFLPSVRWHVVKTQ